MIAGKRKTFFASPQFPDQLCGQPNLLSNGKMGFFPMVESSYLVTINGRNTKCKTRNCESILALLVKFNMKHIYCPVCLIGIPTLATAELEH
jgi:hypothetical protein